MKGAYAAAGVELGVAYLVRRYYPLYDAWEIGVDRRDLYAPVHEEECSLCQWLDLVHTGVEKCEKTLAKLKIGHTLYVSGLIWCIRASKNAKNAGETKNRAYSLCQWLDLVHTGVEKCEKTLAKLKMWHSIYVSGYAITPKEVKNETDS